MTEPHAKIRQAEAMPEPGRWENLIVLCAANCYDGIKLADQHMAEHLSVLGPVLYVDPPLSLLTPLRAAQAVQALDGPRLRTLAPNLARLTPVVQPGPSRRGLASLTSALARRHLRHATSMLGGNVMAVVSAWPLYPVFNSCGERLRMYWAQDDFVGGADLLRMDRRQLDKQERRVASIADLIVAASPVVAATWRDRGFAPVLIPYGADVDAYAAVDQAPRPSDVHLDSPIVGFVGQLNDRTDMRLLEAVADRGRSLLLVGPVNPSFEPRRFEALRQRRNVCWVGPKSFDELPGYLRLIDVGLVPYRDSAFNRGSFPLKTLEYLAAGRAVVATDLPAIRWLDTSLVARASEPSHFADLVDDMFSRGRTQADLAQRQAFAARHSWTKRAAELHRLILAGSAAQ